MYREIALQINNNCNLNCPFCFSDKSDAFISMNSIKKVKEFCVKEKVDTIKITGGEPFLHKNISEIIKIFSNFNVFIFSNCVVKDCINLIDNTGKIKNLTILINYNLPSFYTDNQLKNIHQNIEAIKKINGKIILGRTFYEEPFYIEDILELCKKHKIDTIRVSQSSPKKSYDNNWLNYDKTNLFLSEMKRLDEKILVPNKIKMHFDCPIRPCEIDDSLFEYFSKKKVLSNKCRARVFIGSDLVVKHCYANEKDYPKRYMDEFKTYEELFKYIETVNKKLTESKNVECEGCKYYGDIPCGCLSLS